MTALLQIIRSPLLIFRAVRDIFCFPKLRERDPAAPGPVRLSFRQIPVSRDSKRMSPPNAIIFPADLFDHLPQYVRSDMGQLTVSDGRIRAGLYELFFYL